MKARLLIPITLFLFAYQLSFSQCESVPENYTCIPDAEFEEELVLNGVDTDGVINGQVLTADISDETSLVMVAKGITNLTGIEDFTALQILNVWGNPLGDLDISNNLNLTTLTCYNCSLTSLVLPPSPSALTQITCFNNQLTSLNTSGLSNLATLECHSQAGVGYGTLNLQNNTILTTLNAWNCGLTSLDVSNNEDLLALRVENNSLTTLDLSNNPLLQYLEVDFTGLTTLDVSQTTQLNTLNATWCALEWINVKNGNNDKLFNLDVRNNGFANLCIQVDQDPPVNVAGWDKDATATYMVNCPGLSAEENLISLLKIYPVPTRDNISIQNINYETNYSILNVNGKVIKSGSVNPNNSEVSLENISNGVYFINLSTTSVQTTKKIVKY